MSSTTPESAYWQGLRDAAPFVLVIAPFAAVFGVVAAEAGLSLLETFGFSALVIAGASQIAALQLMIDAAPLAIIIATALAVNLRMAMYSASLAPYLRGAPLWQRAVIAYLNVDQTYALSIARYEDEPELSLPARMAYFFGTATPVLPVWLSMTVVGAVLGNQIPRGLSLDFAVPIAFLAIVAPMLKTLAHMAAALVSVVLSLALLWVPMNAGLLIAALAAMCTGALIETLMGRRAP
ncbi:MAG: AzlC family ABC transporter permease [Pseudomonadota bacterium]